MRLIIGLAWILPLLCCGIASAQVTVDFGDQSLVRAPGDTVEFPLKISKLTAEAKTRIKCEVRIVSDASEKPFWQSTEEKRVYYRNLDPGFDKFRVRVPDSEGVYKLIINVTAYPPHKNAEPVTLGKLEYAITVGSSKSKPGAKSPSAQRRLGRLLVAWIEPEDLVRQLALTGGSGVQLTKLNWEQVLEDSRTWSTRIIESGYTAVAIPAEVAGVAIFKGLKSADRSVDLLELMLQRCSESQLKVFVVARNGSRLAQQPINAEAAAAAAPSAGVWMLEVHDNGLYAVPLDSQRHTMQPGMRNMIHAIGSRYTRHESLAGVIVEPTPAQFSAAATSKSPLSRNQLREIRALPLIDIENDAKGIADVLITTDAPAVVNVGANPLTAASDRVWYIADTLCPLPIPPFTEMAAAKPVSAAELVVFRQYRHQGHSYFYAVNNSPWPVGMRVEASGRSMEIFSGRQQPQAGPATSGCRWEAVLYPYEVVSGKLDMPTSSVTGWAADVHPDLVNRLTADLDRIESDLAKMDDMGWVSLISNPGFEEGTEQQIPGWSFDRSAQKIVQPDSSITHGGGQSLQIASQSMVDWAGPVVTVKSDPFPTPGTGRLYVSAWMRTTDQAQQPSVRFAVEGAETNSDFQEMAKIGSADDAAQGALLSADWKRVFLRIDEFPQDKPDKLRLVIELRGAGQIWVDDVQVRERWLQKHEANAFATALGDARKLAQNGQILEYEAFVQKELPAALQLFGNPDELAPSLAAAKSIRPNLVDRPVVKNGNRDSSTVSHSVTAPAQQLAAGAVTARTPAPAIAPQPAKPTVTEFDKALSFNAPVQNPTSAALTAKSVATPTPLPSKASSSLPTPASLARASAKSPNAKSMDVSYDLSNIDPIAPTDDSIDEFAKPSTKTRKSWLPTVKLPKLFGGKSDAAAPAHQEEVILVNPEDAKYFQDDSRYKVRLLDRNVSADQPAPLETETTPREAKPSFWQKVANPFKRSSSHR